MKHDTKRRKEIYEALHPETRHGGDRASRQLGDLKETDRFTADTAAKTGQSERAVQRDATRGERLGEDVLEQVIGTDLDKGTALPALALFSKFVGGQKAPPHSTKRCTCALPNVGAACRCCAEDCPPA